MAIQIGRTVLTFNIKKKHNLYHFTTATKEICNDLNKNDIISIKPIERTTAENII